LYITPYLGVSVVNSARAAPPGPKPRLVLPHSQLQQLQRCWNMWVFYAVLRYTRHAIYV